MFSLGLGLTGSDFFRVLKQPRDFLVGTFSQIILLPVIAFILVKIWPIAPELAIGVMIIASAPGGVTSNLLTSFAKGDIALSISLTAIISLLSVITIPFIVLTSVNLLSNAQVPQDVSLISISRDMFLIVTLNRSDILPTGDLGIQKGYMVFFDIDFIPNKEYMIKNAEKWRPLELLPAGIYGNSLMKIFNGKYILSIALPSSL